MTRAARSCARAALLAFLAGCAGGTPLLHPAQTLPTGDVRAAGGLSGNVVVGSLAEDLRNARALAVADPTLPGAPGSNPSYAKGALVSAAVAPGIAPFVAARVGIGAKSEGGITYTGRNVRIDVRRSLDLSKEWALSGGVALDAALYGRQQGSTLPNVDLSSLRGYGLDVPLLVGYESTAGLYRLWLGARGGWEHDTIEDLTSEPKSPPIATGPIGLSADRAWVGGVLGLAVGFRHVHLALELDASYETVHGRYNDTTVDIHGLALAPAAAVWWTF